MKPIHLNLASKPWRNTRPFWLSMIALTTAVVLLMAANLHAAYEYFVETEETRAKISEVRASAAETEKIAQESEQRLAATNQNLIDARVEFVNSRIRERTFSWSQLLDHLERVVPDDVRIGSLRPSIPDEGPIKLAINFQAKNHDGFVTMVQNLFSDSHFENPVPTSESNNDGVIRFTLSVNYLPDPVGMVIE